ncbi:type IV secretory system conjugative DNA transfer family protein [Rhodocytophaga rosea]|uniref:Type IV secretory system conjugative DNA transfer family protein n=1 Tax=Rhodocytophaga rosea TaxID=2704465 RepID=A0A6C0GBZ4_9BACT|nr:type IV secretory system conjugative DNA transfer family protein [Rhodocytophaga rosea]QHT65364.1 type IV secretory system conjugative DNA transfer family protein [Rhodocytophaga rosea]
MLSNQERESLTLQQYWYILASVLVALLHYFLLIFTHIAHFIPFEVFEPLKNTYLFLIQKVSWLINPWYIAVIILIGTTFYGLGTRGVKSTSITAGQVRNTLIVGLLLMTFTACSLWFVPSLLKNPVLVISYIIIHFIGQIILAKGATHYSRIFSHNLQNDLFNEDNESFPQEERLLETQNSVNIPTQYQLKGKLRNGWLNIVNPFRGVMVLGIPGSGKTFSVLVPAIEQCIAKGYTAMVYDIKFPDLSKVALQALLQNKGQYHVSPKFYVINFDDVERSHRCNPLLPELMTDIIDAYESAQTIMFNLNRTWIQKQGDFFVDSAINFVTAVIWVLKRIDERQKLEYEQAIGMWNSTNGTAKPLPPPTVCTFPHVIEFANREYDKIFPVLLNYPEIENYARMFADAFRNGAMEQLEGQIASARNGMARLVSPTLYWVMSGNDFTLDINDPEHPKIVCIGNNPQRQGIYGAALSLYNARLITLINKKNKLKSALFIDELPTLYFKGLDQLIATARSNKVATFLGIQDFSQLERDYGTKEAKVIEGIIGNLFAGQVTGPSAEGLSKRFGKTNQMKESITQSKNDTTINRSTQLQEVIPASKISALSQGWMVGSVADDMGAEIKTKMFHAKLLVQPSDKPLPEMPIIYDFEKLKKNIPTEEKTSIEAFKTQLIFNNLEKIKREVDLLLTKEMERLPDHLRQGFQKTTT